MTKDNEGCYKLDSSFSPARCLHKSIGQVGHGRIWITLSAFKAIHLPSKQSGSTGLSTAASVGSFSHALSGVLLALAPILDLGFALDQPCPWS